MKIIAPFLAASFIALAALLALAACGDVPGADGRYAVRGGNGHGSP